MKIKTCKHFYHKIFIQHWDLFHKDIDLLLLSHVNLFTTAHLICIHTSIKIVIIVSDIKIYIIYVAALLHVHHLDNWWRQLNAIKTFGHSKWSMFQFLKCIEFKVGLRTYGQGVELCSKLQDRCQIDDSFSRSGLCV